MTFVYQNIYICKHIMASRPVLASVELMFNGYRVLCRGKGKEASNLSQVKNETSFIPSIPIALRCGVYMQGQFRIYVCFTYSNMQDVINLRKIS